MGLVCAILGMTILAGAIPFGAGPIAYRAGTFPVLDGIVFGALLAGVTRTRRPVLIYGLLLAAAAALWPLYAGWPASPPLAPEMPEGRQELIHNYLDILRIVLFLLAVPYPFARLGFHAPDVNAPGVKEEETI